MDTIKCRDCDCELDQSYLAPNKKPCPRCGSTVLTVIKNMSATFSVKPSIYSKLRWWERIPKVKALQWGVRGDDLYHKTGRWSVVVRTYDRVKDWYYEHITDKETGQVLRHTEEKLSEHKQGLRIKRIKPNDPGDGGDSA
jgi:hypothetical protein